MEPSLFCPECGAEKLRTPFGLRCSSRSCDYREREVDESKILKELRRIVERERRHEKDSVKRDVFEAEVKGVSHDIATIECPQSPFEEGDPIGYLRGGKVSSLGVVIFSGEELTVRLDDSTRISEGEELKVCRAENLIGYDLQLNYLDRLAQGMYKDVSGVIFNKARFTNINEIRTEKPRLDESQKGALESILGLRGGELLLVIGPPGCGKTTVIREAVRELSKKEKVLITSHTNRAVDNALEGLEDKLDISLRVGRPGKVHPNVEKFLLSYKAKTRLGEELKQKNEEIKKIRKKLNEFRATTSLKNISREEYKALRKIKEERSTKAQGDVNKLNEKLKRLYDEKNMMLEEESERLVNGARIIGSTLIKSQLHPLEAVEFDTVLIDECSQASIPLALLGMVKAKKWVLFGDHNQLLPIFRTIGMDMRSDHLLEELSSFCHLFGDYPDRAVWLRSHYRSNPKIINFSSKHIYEVYDGEKIEPDKKCKGKIINGGNRFLDIPVTFLNVKGEHKYIKGAGTYENKKEANVIVEIVNLLKNFVKPEDIGVIVPYRGQRGLIKSKIEDDIEVSTVDSFQGREREVIIFGVTSTSEGMIDFPANKNRFNVAVTRAISKLIVIGNEKVIESKNNLISDFVEYAEGLGCRYDVQTISGNVRQTGNRLHVKSPEVGIITGNLVGKTAKTLFLEANNNIYLIKQ